MAKDGMNPLGGLGGLIPMAMEKGGGSAMLGLIPAALDYNAKDKDKDKKDATVKTPGMKHGGAVKKMAKGGSVSSASKRADGCAQRGKTRGKMR
jgi:hypothetical protein